MRAGERDDADAKLLDAGQILEGVSTGMLKSSFKSMWVM